jgi:hypothetical protein
LEQLTEGLFADKQDQAAGASQNDPERISTGWVHRYSTFIPSRREVQVRVCSYGFAQQIADARIDLALKL